MSTNSSENTGSAAATAAGTSDSPAARFASVFAVLFTPATPLLAGITAARSHPVLVDRIGVVTANRRNRLDALPAVPDFVFNHFHELLWVLFILGLALAAANWFQLRVADPALRLGRQLVLLSCSAILGAAFLALYLLAAAQALVPAH
ncbi:MAG: hypothetical protein LBR07_04045 [Puniceicoccales bacterium]|jgi:hypothetical protein|nr:hypothetical protein [Puniceicoccales bacterium]